MSARALFFTGAPESSALEWESAVLLDSFTTPIARFAGVHSTRDDHELPPHSLTGPEYALWRSLDLDRQHLATGHSQILGWADEYQGNARFCTISALSFASPRFDDHIYESFGSHQTASELDQEESSQFYEESFAIHATAGPSQKSNLLLPQLKSCLDSENLTSLSSNATFSHLMTQSDSSTSSLEAVLPPLIIPSGYPISDLAVIPNARYVESIQPQTMSVNLIVGIISALPPRPIKTRRGVDVEIVELLVGDDTKSGFGINFWLNASNSGRSSDDLRHFLETIRPQDIVLLRNVAVSSFRGRVYGQSLRRGMTKVLLLYRNRVDRSDMGGCYRFEDLEAEKHENSELAKTKRVKDWTLRFSGPGVFRKADSGMNQCLKEHLPPDTQ